MTSRQPATPLTGESKSDGSAPADAEPSTGPTGIHLPHHSPFSGLTPYERRRRVIGISIWAALFLIGCLAIGLPTDPVEAFVWIWVATIAWSNFRPFRSHVVFLRDWAAVIVLLVIYNVSRGWAGHGIPHSTEMIHADEHMWGWLTGGEVPTLWLQHHLYNAAHIHWYDVLASFVYFSHFVTALAVAAVLWIRNRTRWASFVRRWFTLTALGLATYFIYPAAPPWWAASHDAAGNPVPLGQGLIEPVARISTRGWDALGLHHAGSVLNAAQVEAANPVAAIPSLHSAYALLVVVFFLPTIRKRWWPLLFAYPLAMTFTLVYSGEHYMIDVIVGWTYTVVTCLLVWAAERGWAWFQARRASDAAGLRERDDVTQESARIEKA